MATNRNYLSLASKMVLGFGIPLLMTAGITVAILMVATSTSSMIEESVKNANNGVGIASEVSKALDEIVGSVGKTADLVSEIAAASQEQSQGIDQVNTAVTQMDKVTQQNAANAEESASASEELSAQAESMNQAVQDLVALVGGADGGNRSSTNWVQGRPTTGTVVRVPGLESTNQAFHQIAQPIPERKKSAKV